MAGSKKRVSNRCTSARASFEPALLPGCRVPGQQRLQQVHVRVLPAQRGVRLPVFRGAVPEPAMRRGEAGVQQVERRPGQRDRAGGGEGAVQPGERVEDEGVGVKILAAVEGRALRRGAEEEAAVDVVLIGLAQERIPRLRRPRPAALAEQGGMAEHIEQAALHEQALRAHERRVRGTQGFEKPAMHGIDEAVAAERDERFQREAGESGRRGRGGRHRFRNQNRTDAAFEL